MQFKVYNTTNSVSKQGFALAFHAFTRLFKFCCCCYTGRAGRVTLVSSPTAWRATLTDITGRCHQVALTKYAETGVIEDAWITGHSASKTILKSQPIL